MQESLSIIHWVVRHLDFAQFADATQTPGVAEDAVVATLLHHFAIPRSQTRRRAFLTCEASGGFGFSGT